MSPDWKPEGYTSVSPYLIVADAERAIAFMERAFGATELRRFEMPAGALTHAEVLIDDSVVMVGEAGGEWLACPHSMHVYVEDVDGAYERALAAGADPLEAPGREEGDPDRRAGVRDPCGNTWWLATAVIR